MWSNQTLLTKPLKANKTYHTIIPLQNRGNQPIRRDSGVLETTMSRFQIDHPVIE